MTERIDIMVDIETLSTKTNGTIIQIAAIAFNIETGEHLAFFNEVADIEKNEKLVVDGSTIKWWLKTDKELLTDLLHKGEKSTEQILKEFHNWLLYFTEDCKPVYLWGNGILFDNKMIQYQFESIGLEYPIFYRNDRDVRTLVELAANKLNISENELKKQFNNESLVKHDAFDDVRYQINLAVNCYKTLVDKEG